MSDDFEDMIVSYADARFELRPHPKYRDLVRLTEFAEGLGYKMPFSTKQYSLEDVQEILRTEGPSAFLKIVRVEEDISPKAPQPAVEQLVAQRLARLAPTSDLIITDPYLFPGRPQPDAAQYAQHVAALIAPLLADVARVTAVVNDQTNPAVEQAVGVELAALNPGATLSTVRSEDFHDRFWIADRSRGVIVGASLNKIGGRIFFLDSLSDGDVFAVVHELAALGV
ncbi:MAG: hypothetical protein M0Z51_14115 [Propionibacterium sp.]|nr:hypothetical protein [Propionibacterium sp.]